MTDAGAGNAGAGLACVKILLVAQLLLVVSIVTEAFHLGHGRGPRPSRAAVRRMALQRTSLRITPDETNSPNDDGKNRTKMQRPVVDRVLASTLFRLEMDRVKNSSVEDEKGRVGEPMEWSQRDSIANKFSMLVANNDLGYKLKQWVADIVAGNEYDQDEISQLIDDFIYDKNDNNNSNANDGDGDGSEPVVKVAMFSFTTCPFCRRAKDLLDSKDIPYSVMELDELEGNRGNEIRAMLGRKTRRTSVPSIFVDGRHIGGCNDGGMGGLIPLEESGQLDLMLQRK